MIFWCEKMAVGRNKRHTISLYLRILHKIIIFPFPFYTPYSHLFFFKVQIIPDICVFVDCVTFGIKRYLHKGRDLVYFVHCWFPITQISSWHIVGKWQNSCCWLFLKKEFKLFLLGLESIRVYSILFCLFMYIMLNFFCSKKRFWGPVSNLI